MFACGRGVRVGGEEERPKAGKSSRKPREAGRARGRAHLAAKVLILCAPMVRECSSPVTSWG